jgi:peptide/nickel transport system ATP-binding protein
MKPGGPLLEAEGLVRRYAMRRGMFGRIVEVRAVDGVSLKLERGRTLGLVGESGCGKSTTGRLVLGMETPDAGRVSFDGAVMPPPGSAAWRGLRARMQMVFQDPLGALDRRLSIATQIAEPLDIHGIAGASERGARAFATRMSFPAASANARFWRAPWRPIPRCWCVTNRSARLMFPFRRRS